MSDPRPIPEALLERYLAGDLGADERRALEERLAASQADRDRLAALRADSAAFLIKHPPGPVAARLATPSRARSFAWWLAPVALAASALVAVALLAPPPEPDVTLKGDLALTVYRQTAEGSELLESGAVVRAGDRLRFELRAPEPGFVAVVSRDGAGHVTVYYPYASKRPAAYDPKKSLLAGAISLDDVHGDETVWALHSKTEFDLVPIVEALEKGGAPAANGVAYTELRWVKR